MNILGIFDVGVITGALRAIGAFLCNWIYDLIAMIYQLFMTVSRLNILSSDEIGPIYQRVTMILTIVMVFYITFEFVKFVVEPDGITDKNKGVGNIVTRMIIVVVLIAFVPRIFSLAYELQNKIIENQVISKVILGKTNSEFSTFGNQFSADVLSLFYSVDEENCGNKCEDAKIVVNGNLERLRSGANLKLATNINETVKQEVDGQKEEVPIIKFQGLTAIIVGGFVVYILIMYSIDVGIRYAQLIFLQIMSPIAIMGYLSPKKDNMFQKWGKQCLSTYLDLFIRISLIYFVLLIIETLGNAYNTGSLFEGLEGISGSMRVFTYIVLIMGLLAFAQRAPKLISNLFPGLGGSGIGFGISSKDRISPTTGAFKKAYGGTRSTINAGRRVAGAAAGAMYGAYKGLKSDTNNKKNKAWTATKASYRGLKAGAGKGGSVRKSLDTVRQSVKKDEDIVRSGGTVLGHDLRGGHYQEVALRQDRTIEDYQQAKKGMDAMSAQLDEFKQVKTIKKSWDAAKAAGNDAEARKLESQYKALSQALRGEIAKYGENVTITTSGEIKDSQGKILGDLKTITYKYSETDANGKPIAGTDKVETYQFDSGDAAFAESFAHVAKEERRKTKGSALDSLTVTIKREEKDPITGQLKMKDVSVAIADLTDAEYAQYIHKVKDAASIAETKTKDKAYGTAHANAANDKK